MTERAPLPRFRVSCPDIAENQDHLYHAPSALVAAQRFVNQCGTPGQVYEVAVRSGDFIGASVITVSKQG
jgi:hypothetical protein